MGNSDNKMFAHIFANTCIRITTSIKLPILFHNTVRSLLPDIAIRYAIYNLVLGAQAQNNPSFTAKVKQPVTLKNVAPTALPVPYRNQKSAWLDSEIFRRQFFFIKFLIFRHSWQNDHKLIPLGSNNRDPTQLKTEWWVTQKNLLC